MKETCWPTSWNFFQTFAAACIYMHTPYLLWHRWFGDRKGIRPVKNWVVGCWHGYLSGARCTASEMTYTVSSGALNSTPIQSNADLHMAQLMPLPLNVSCFSKIQIGFTFLVPAHLGSPGRRALNGCVCACVHACVVHCVKPVAASVCLQAAQLTPNVKHHSIRHFPGYDSYESTGANQGKLPTGQSILTPINWLFQCSDDMLFTPDLRYQ